MSLTISKKMAPPVAITSGIAVVSVVYDTIKEAIHLNICGVHHSDALVLLNNASQLLTGALGPDITVEGVNFYHNDTEVINVTAHP